MIMFSITLWNGRCTYSSSSLLQRLFGFHTYGVPGVSNISRRKEGRKEGTPRKRAKREQQPAARQELVTNMPGQVNRPIRSTASGFGPKEASHENELLPIRSQGRPISGSGHSVLPFPQLSYGPPVRRDSGVRWQASCLVGLGGRSHVSAAQHSTVQHSTAQL